MINVMNELCESNPPLVYAFANNVFTVYTLDDDVKALIRAKTAVPIEVLTAPDLSDLTVKHDNCFYTVSGTTFDLNRLHDWHFGTVYAIVQCNLSFKHRLIDMSCYMISHDCDNIIDAWCVYRDSQFSSIKLCGFLIVISHHRTIEHNILITITTPIERELSPRSALRYENFRIMDCLKDIEHYLIKEVNIAYPSPARYIDVAMISQSNGMEYYPIQYNMPFVLDVTFNKCVDANGWLNYYTKGCVGYGRSEVKNGYSTIVAQLPDSLVCNPYDYNIPENEQSITTQWLIKHTYYLDFKYCNEKKVRYNRYY